MNIQQLDIENIDIGSLPFLALVTIDGDTVLGSDNPALFLAMTRNSYSLPSFSPSTVPRLSGLLVSQPCHNHSKNESSINMLNCK